VESQIVAIPFALAPHHGQLGVLLVSDETATHDVFTEQNCIKRLRILAGIYSPDKDYRTVLPIICLASAVHCSNIKARTGSKYLRPLVTNLPGSQTIF
jgi:hypothetical protein